MGGRLMPTAQLFEEGIIPEVLRGKILEVCKYDGYPIIRDEDLKHAECPNTYCYGHVRARAVRMLDILGVKGCGPATCGKMIEQYKIQSHMELIPIVFDEPPYLHLWEVADIADIPGYGDKLQDILAGYGSFSEFFFANPNHKLTVFKRYLLECEKFCKIRPPQAKRSIRVMITGSIAGYGNRKQFITLCNDILGEHLRVTLSDSAIQSADYLITENLTSDGEKARAARRSGTPIVTPAMFIQELRKLCLG